VRRAVLLIYATAVVYFFYAPWNYLPLGALLLRRRTDRQGFTTSNTESRGRPPLIQETPGAPNGHHANVVENQTVGGAGLRQGLPRQPT
jgi:hypothetical protein